jgi:hypothetical protein
MCEILRFSHIKNAVFRFCEADEVEWLGNKAAELLADYERLKPAHNFTTFETVEKVWAEVVEPAVPGFKSMAKIEKELPDDSPWKANSGVPEIRKGSLF